MQAKWLTAILVVAGVGTDAFAAHPHRGHPAWDNRLNFKSIEERLLHEAVSENVSMDSYLRKQKLGAHKNDEIRLLTLESGLKAVFKSGSYRYAERAAYKASCALGLRLVPPTVVRTIRGAEGSLQFFVESSHELIDGKKDYFKKLHPKQLSDMKLFYYVFGQWDAHDGNQIIASHGDELFLALIDNAGIHHRIQTLYGGDLFIEKGDESSSIKSVDTPTFPFKQAKKINSGSKKKMYELFGNIIPNQLSRLVKSPHELTYVFWKNTLWMKRYPLKTTQVYYRSTLQALKKLDRTLLRGIWSEWRAIDERHAEQLIDLTLQRRDEIVKIAESKGNIVEDVKLGAQLKADYFEAHVKSDGIQVVQNPEAKTEQISEFEEFWWCPFYAKDWFVLLPHL